MYPVLIQMRVTQTPLRVGSVPFFVKSSRVLDIYKSGGFCGLNPNVCWINPGCCWFHAYCRTITQLPYQAGRPHSSAAWPMSICALLLSTCREARGAHSDLPWRCGWFTSWKTHLYMDDFRGCPHDSINLHIEKNKLGRLSNYESQMENKYTVRRIDRFKLRCWWFMGNLFQEWDKPMQKGHLFNFK